MKVAVGIDIALTCFRPRYSLGAGKSNPYKAKEIEMNKLIRFLIASVLTVAAIVSTPSRAAAINWCQDCIQNPENCYACCRCDGYTHIECRGMCGV